MISDAAIGRRGIITTFVLAPLCSAPVGIFLHWYTAAVGPIDFCGAALYRDLSFYAAMTVVVCSLVVLRMPRKARRWFVRGKSIGIETADERCSIAPESIFVAEMTNRVIAASGPNRVYFLGSEELPFASWMLIDTQKDRQLRTGYLGMLFRRRGMTGEAIIDAIEKRTHTELPRVRYDSVVKLLRPAGHGSWT